VCNAWPCGAFEKTFCLLEFLESISFWGLFPWPNHTIRPNPFHPDSASRKKIIAWILHFDLRSKKSTNLNDTPSYHHPPPSSIHQRVSNFTYFFTKARKKNRLMDYIAHLSHLGKYFKIFLPVAKRRSVYLYESFMRLCVCVELK
jgi:hypothetical protein